MMKLYFTPGACSLSPHIVLREARLEFELHKVDLATKKTDTGADLAEISPKAQVPVLVLDDGSVLTEVPAIVQYLADRRPEADLAPAPGTPARYRLQEWLNFVTAELHKGLGPLFNPNMPEVWQQATKNTVAAKFAFLERHLQSHDYLVGGRFSVADSYAFTIVNWSSLFDIDLAPWHNLRGYMSRIAGRPSVRAAMQYEGLSIHHDTRGADDEAA